LALFRQAERYLMERG